MLCTTGSVSNDHFAEVGVCHPNHLHCVEIKLDIEEVHRVYEGWNPMLVLVLICDEQKYFKVHVVHLYPYGIWQQFHLKILDQVVPLKHLPPLDGNVQIHRTVVEED